MSGYTSTVVSDRVVWDDYENITFDKGLCHIVRKQVVMVEGDKTVGVYERDLLKGTSKNGVVWHRWKTLKSDHYSVKTGHLESYVKTGKFFHKSTKASSFRWSGHSKVCAGINRLLLKNGLEPMNKFDNRSIFRTSYPLFDHFDTMSYRSLGIPHMHSKDIQEFTRKMFGKTRYRKDLVRAVAGTTNPHAIKNAYHVRGLVPVDWIIKYLVSTKNKISYGVPMMTSIRPAFQNMTMNQRKAIMTALSDNTIPDNYYVEDLLDFAIQLPKETVQAIKMKPSNLYEVHNILSLEITKHKTKDVEIKQIRFAKQISEIDWTDTGISMVPATSTHQVINWGVEMGHCIGSYASHAANGTYTLAGIYQDGKLIGNAMFQRRKAVQIFGKFNKQLPDSVLKTIIEKLDICDFKSAWGVPHHLTAKPIALADDGVLAALPF